MDVRAFFGFKPKTSPEPEVVETECLWKAIAMAIKKHPKKMEPRVCDDCECPFVGKGTTCDGCTVRAIPNSVFVECECGKVIVNPTEKQVKSGKDEDGEWWCPKCR